MTRLESMSSSFLAKDRNRILIVGGGYLGYHVAQGLQKRIKESGGIVTIVGAVLVLFFVVSVVLGLAAFPWGSMTDVGVIQV